MATAKQQQYGRAHYIANRESRLKYAAEYRKTKPREVRNCKLRAAFGVTADDYDLMFRLQRGVCAICFQPETGRRFGKIKRLSIDHDHVSGRVRGLLCLHCNLALGYLHDDPLRAHSAMKYLEDAGHG